MQNKDFKVVQRPEIKVIGISCQTSNASDRGPKDIPQLWDRFYRENILEKIPNKVSDEVIALYFSYEGDHTKPYSILIGCMVNSLTQIPSGMVGKVVPASKFAVFHAQGDFPKSLIDTWKTIWDSSLKRTYSGDYELYGSKFASSKEVDVFIAVEK